MKKNILKTMVAGLFALSLCQSGMGMDEKKVQYDFDNLAREAKKSGNIGRVLVDIATEYENKMQGAKTADDWKKISDEYMGVVDEISGALKNNWSEASADHYRKNFFLEESWLKKMKETHYNLIKKEVSDDFSKSVIEVLKSSNGAAGDASDFVWAEKNFNEIINRIPPELSDFSSGLKSQFNEERSIAYKTLKEFYNKDVSKGSNSKKTIKGILDATPNDDAKNIILDMLQEKYPNEVRGFEGSKVDVLSKEEESKTNSHEPIKAESLKARSRAVDDRFIELDKKAKFVTDLIITTSKDPYLLGRHFEDLIVYISEMEEIAKKLINDNFKTPATSNIDACGTIKQFKENIDSKYGNKNINLFEKMKKLDAKA